MTSKQESKLNMYDAVITFAGADPTITAPVPAFGVAFTAFGDKVQSIKDNAQAEADVITGIAMDKSQFRKDLSQVAADVAAALFAFASTTNNNELRQKANFSFSDLLRLKDEELAPVALNIHDAATTNLASLATYGITPAKLTILFTAIGNFTNKVPAPRNASSQRATYAEMLRQFFIQADDVLKNQLDKVAVQFKLINLGFYTTYKNNRIIVDAATSATKLIGKTMEQITGAQITGATLQVVGKSYTAISNAVGEYLLKIPVPGTYSVKATKTGYADKTIDNIVITLGQSALVNFHMTAI